MRLLLLNDTHLGVKRQSGTTKQSREDLEKWMIEQFSECLSEPHEKVIILGDLFDKRNVEEHVMAEVINLLRDEDCMIVAGNHDLGGVDDHTMSSAEFVAKMSGSEWIDRPTLEKSVYIVPHLHSQEEFDKAIQECPDNIILMTHCNIDSPFAHSDHSLNLSMQQIKDLEGRGVDVIAGHEHAKRDYHNVTILGNQFPSSIADCIGGSKCMHILSQGELLKIPTWDTDGFYRGSEIEDHPHNFISITGTCCISESSEIVKSVADLRKISSAFVVKNSIKVEEVNMERSDEVITQFNILDMLIEEIPEELKEEVKSCL